MAKSTPSTGLKVGDYEQVCFFRMEGHNLSRKLPPGSLLEAAGACGIQNTPPGSAALALHARVARVTPGEIDHALAEDKSLLETWSLRAAPTVFPTRDRAVFTQGVLPDDEAALRAFIRGAIPALD